MGFAKRTMPLAPTETGADTFINVENLTLTAASITPKPEMTTFVDAWCQIFLVQRNASEIISKTLLTQGYVHQANGLTWVGSIKTGAIAEVMGRAFSQGNLHADLATLTDDIQR